MRKPVAALVVFASAVASACASDAPAPSASRDATSAPPSASPSPAPGRFDDSDPVEFAAADGEAVRGRIWGDGATAVVLAHGHDLSIGQGAWPPFARFLVDEGFTVLTFNFRGFCDAEECSPSRLDYDTYWNDVVGAVRHLEREGFEHFVVVGASMGGIATFRAAADPAVDVSAIVSLSTPQWPSRYYPQEPPENDVSPARLRAIEEPVLFVAGDEETPFADDARSMHEAAGTPKSLLLVPSGLHSSQLVTEAEPEVVEQTRTAIVEFIHTHVS